MYSSSSSSSSSLFWSGLVVSIMASLLLCPEAILSLSDRQREKLDAIEEILHLLQKEIDNLKRNDNTDNRKPFPSKVTGNDFTASTTGSQVASSGGLAWITSGKIDPASTETERRDQVTTTWNQGGKADSGSSSSDSDVTSAPQQTISSEIQNAQRQHSSITTTQQQQQTTTGRDGREGEGEREMERKRVGKEEDGAGNEVEKIRHLIDEGEDLERQLKGIFVHLRSLSHCTRPGEKCTWNEGVEGGGGGSSHHGCCKGLRCISGTCRLDCIPSGASCSENFFCCPGSKCVPDIDGSGTEAFTCQ